MSHYIEQWADDAVSYIRFKPDRPPVKEELLAHMEAKYDDYVREGMPLAQAERKVLNEMGEARDTGKLLAQIHKPYLGWIWRGTRVLLVLVLVLTFLRFLPWTDNLRPYDGPSYFGANPYTEESSESGGRRILYLEPGCSASCNGYRFTVTKAALWQYGTDDGGAGRLHFQIDVFNPRPWAGYAEIPRWLYAVDSLGNYYYSCNESIRNSDLESYIAGNPQQNGLFTVTWDMWASGSIPQDAQWLELCYDRDGRHFTLRIDLTGGEAA